MDDMEALRLLTPADEAMAAPGKIEFAAYPGGQLSKPDGRDHLMWTVGIGKDHTATIYMHRDDYAALTGKKPGETVNG